MPIDASVRSVPGDSGDHVVQFYDHDFELADTVARYLHAGLSRGGAAVVIATPEHGALLDDRLTRAGLDVAAARASGALIELDAADTLAQIMVDEAPDAERFAQVIGPLVRQAAEGGHRVHAFGEMVALLWTAGSVGSAVELEEFWNGLREQLEFKLFCAYPNSLTETTEGVRGFVDVCATHSQVVAAAPRASTATVTRRFPRSPAAPAAARRFVTDWLAEHGRRELIESAELAVSELATNAVAHARSDFTVSVECRNDGVRILVGDASTDAPELHLGDATATGGRGLAIISALASAIGHELLDGGKLVWADLTLRPAAQAGVS